MALTKEDIQALQAALAPQFEEINSKFDETNRKIDALNQNVTKLEAMPHQIQLLAEGQKHLDDKITRLQESVDDMAPTVTALDILHKMREHQ